MDLILFDMDNTLITSDKAHIESYERAFEKYGLGKASKTKLKSLLGMVNYRLVGKLFPKLTLKQCKEVVDLKHKFLMGDATGKVKAVPGAKTVLRKLKKDYHLGLVSNCRTKEIPKLMNAAGMDLKLFEFYIGYDSVKMPKPAPDEVFKAESIVKHKASYLIGDSIYDMGAAKNAKVKAIGVLTGHYTRAQLKKYKPVKILKSVADLPKFLSKAI